MTDRLTAAVVTSTAIGSLRAELLDRVTEQSPLTAVVLDLGHARLSDGTVAAPPATVPDWQRQALELLLDPELQATVLFREGLSAVGFTLYVREGMAVRFDAGADSTYRLGAARAIGATAELLVDLLGSADSGGGPSVTLADSGYFALLGWVAAYRKDWLPLGAEPRDAVVTEDDLRGGLESDAIAETLAVMAALGAPSSFAGAFEHAPTAGLHELREAGLLTGSPEGLVLTEAGASLIGPIAFPRLSLSVLTVRLADDAGGTTVVLADTSGRLAAVLPSAGVDGRWTFELSSVDARRAGELVRDAFTRAAGRLPTPFVDGRTTWPAPLWDTAR